MAEPMDGSPAPKPEDTAEPKTGTETKTEAEGAKPAAKDVASTDAGGRKIGLLIGVVLGALILAWAAVKYIDDAGKIGETIVKATKTTGSASIGGPFELTDHNGKRATDRGFPDKYLLVYFGYTYCPDICPTGLTEISNALDQIGPLADKVQPLFITVDPERDTPEQLKEYATYFHPRLLGLTGTSEEVASAAKAYRIYYAKVKPKDAAADPDDYTVDHSAIIYLMAPDGKFIQHFGHGTNAETLAGRLKEIVRP
jgi:cytochrome oxidase Cu insertion factor (SCO1/SenC/PrrC family)